MTLKRGLTRLEGVADAKLIVKPAHMEVTMKPGYWPDLPKMEDTIRRAGYKPQPEKIGLVVTGKLVKQGDRYAVELEGMQSPATLRVEPGKVAVEQFAGSVDQAVRLAGLWTAPEAGGKDAGMLTLTEVGPVK